MYRENSLAVARTFNNCVENISMEIIQMAHYQPHSSLFCVPEGYQPPQICSYNYTCSCAQPDSVKRIWF